VIGDPNTVPAISNPEDHPKVMASSGVHQEPEQQTTTSKGMTRTQLWLRRLQALLFVTVCATFGVLLVILPWTSKWTDNPLLLTSPELRNFVSSGFFRGFASGLGVLDLWLGFWEAIHYHERPDVR
jgi:hypothetical protein